MEIINLDMTPSTVTPNAHAGQYDSARTVRFMLKNGGVPFTLAGTETITAEITRSDNTDVTVNVANTSSNYVDVVFDDTVCTVKGLYACELRLKDSDGFDIGSKNFALLVQRDPYDGQGVSVETVGPADICTFETNLPEPYQSVTVNVVATGGYDADTQTAHPINGYSSANITRCGVNLLHVNSRVSQTTASVTYTSDDNYIELNGTKYGGAYADLSALTITLPAGTYYLKAFEISGTATNAPSITAYNGSDLTSNILNNERVLTLNAPTTFRFRFALWTDNAVYTNYKIGIVISTASISEYSEYNGQTYTIAFGQTVYGGVLDVTRGKLHVTWGGDNIGSLNWSYSSADSWFQVSHTTHKHPQSDALCSCYPVVYTLGGGFVNESLAMVNGYLAIKDSTFGSDVDALKTALNGQMVVYELATPFDIDITPEVISAIVGVNNVFADCGETTVKYLTVE